MRIVSVVPSQTELLHDLGLEKEVIGITKFCIHPEEWFRTKTRVGGTKNLDLEKIRSLKPDLIIANREENEKEQILELQKEFPVWVSDISSLDEACAMIIQVGVLCRRQENAEKLVKQIRHSFKSLQPLREPATALYFIWDRPMMIAGTGTFIDHMLTLQNIRNLSPNARYPEISPGAASSLNPELVLLSSEPYPYNEKHVRAYQSLFPRSKIMLVDGEMFSWYGSRLLQAPAYFNAFLSKARQT